MLSKIVGWLLPNSVKNGVSTVQDAVRGKRTYLAALALAAPALLSIADAFIGLPTGGLYEFVKSMPSTDAWQQLMTAAGLAGLRAAK